MDSSSARTLAENGYIIWVTPEGSDIGAYPFQGLDHVLHSVISGRIGVLRAQESQSTQSVVDSYQNNSFIDQVVGAVGPSISISTGEGSAMDPEHNRKVVSQSASVYV